MFVFTFIYSIDNKSELEARTAIEFENRDIETPAAAIKLKIGEENKPEAMGRKRKTADKLERHAKKQAAIAASDEMTRIIFKSKDESNHETERMNIRALMDELKREIVDLKKKVK